MTRFEFTDEEKKIARNVAKKIVGLNHPFFEDAESIGLTAIWQNRDLFDPERSTCYPSFIHIKAKQAAIDGFREVYGRKGSLKESSKKEEFDPLFHASSTGGADQMIDLIVMEETIDKMDDREKHIVLCLVEDMPKQDIAKSLDLTPGRVSQLLGGIKKKVEKELERAS